MIQQETRAIQLYINPDVIPIANSLLGLFDGDEDALWEVMKEAAIEAGLGDILQKVMERTGVE